MPDMIVMKFGGTSSHDARAMANIVEIISRHRDRNPIVVISAIAQATNMLERAGNLAAEGKPGEARDTLLSLFERHHAILDELVKDRQRHVELSNIMTTSLKELEELVQGVAILRELTPRTLDSFYAYGELSSSHLVAAALQEHGVNAQWVDSKNFMLTDDNYTSALPVMDMVEARLDEIVRPLVQQGVVPVTQGFLGVASSGHRTTMGRESSDFSASIIGAALRVDDIQIWTDVDGVLTADPRVVRTPKKVKALSFEEAFELAYFGAKILHPHTMLPALERKIPIHIFNSRRPKESGTMITHDLPSDFGILVKSIAFKRNLTLLELTPRKRYSQYIFWEHIYSVLTKYGVRTLLTGTSEYTVALVVDGKDVIEGLLNDLGAVGTIATKSEKGILCVVGRNMYESSDLLSRLFRAVSGFPISFVSYGASKSSISLVVDDAVIHDLVQKLHEEFFTAAADGRVFEELAHDVVQVPAISL